MATHHTSALTIPINSPTRRRERWITRGGTHRDLRDQTSWPQSTRLHGGATYSGEKVPGSPAPRTLVEDPSAISVFRRVSGRRCRHIRPTVAWVHPPSTVNGVQGGVAPSKVTTERVRLPSVSSWRMMGCSAKDYISEDWAQVRAEPGTIQRDLRWISGKMLAGIYWDSYRCSWTQRRGSPTSGIRPAANCTARESARKSRACCAVASGVARPIEGRRTSWQRVPTPAEAARVTGKKWAAVAVGESAVWAEKEVWAQECRGLLFFFFFCFSFYLNFQIPNLNSIHSFKIHTSIQICTYKNPTWCRYNLY
jgi:hypothetical protein